MKTKHLWVSVLRLALIALLISGTVPGLWAGGNDDDDDDDDNVIPFPEAELYLELNDTDKDLGIHSSIDGGPWTRLDIEDSREQKMLGIKASRSLRKQGLTQLFFESAEPTLDEVSASEFFRRFPQGEYEISALTIDQEEMESEVELSHVLPDRPRNVRVAGVPAAERCDSDSLPSVSAPVVIDWDPVIVHHPEIGRSGPIVIARYQFFVEREGVKLSVDLPPTVTQFQVPAEILALGDEFKFEIIARDENGNNTAIESCFVLD